MGRRRAPRRAPARGRSSIAAILRLRRRLSDCAASACRPARSDRIASRARPVSLDDRGPGELDGYAEAAAADRIAFEHNLASAGVRHRVRHVRADSAQAHGDVHGEIDVLFIDGAHRYGPARADIRDWGGRVSSGGALLIHDAYSSVGVTAAILRELVFGRRFRYVGRSRSLAQYRADLAGASLPARARNAVAQLSQLGWFARNVALKVLLTLGGGKALRRFGRTVPEWPY